MDKPLVSVCCLTYNHKNFIEQALQGFLIQKTNFTVEIIVHDDASTDGTAEIVRDYYNQYPDKIVPIFQKENQYSKGIRPSPNFVWPKARGKYIALCEGDDYWTDPLKLQKQVDFLEANDEYSICFHDVDVRTHNPVKETNVFQLNYFNNKCVFTFDELLEGSNLMHTPSVVFRNQGSFPDFEAFTGDYFLHLHNASFGKIKRIKEKMAVYRIHENGVFSNRDTWDFEKQLFFFKQQANAYAMLRDNYCKSRRQLEIVNERIFSLTNNARVYHLQKKEYRQAQKCAFRQFGLFAEMRKLRLNEWFSVFFTLVCPRLISQRVRKNFPSPKK